jgi:Phage integrase family
MAAARASTDPRDRLVVELLARTGMRAGQLADLDADAVVQIGAGHWLRIPLGKLRNDRCVPLHPDLVGLLAAWTAANLEHIRRCKRLVADHRGILDRHVIGRIVRRVAAAAGVPGVHPHRLRHTLATQAINRGMRLEAIAALLGHQKMEMTLIYAKICAGSRRQDWRRSGTATSPKAIPGTASSSPVPDNAAGPAPADQVRPRPMSVSGLARILPANGSTRNPDREENAHISFRIPRIGKAMTLVSASPVTARIELHSRGCLPGENHWSFLHPL